MELSKGKERAVEQDGEQSGQSIAGGAGPELKASPPSVCIITIGMAGSGKTTFIHRLTSYLHGLKKPPYVLNLDPAVVNLGYEANIDIRDTISYKEVMKQYNLGPNGGILTALNLFTTKFDQVLGFVDKKAQSGTVPYILLDTPGQIEIFTWSASGAIITDSLASSLPTVVAYIIDTPRTYSPETFMSNMLYACSILYKTKLPFILVFNKTDVKDWEFAKEWMEDFEKFQEALMRKKTSGTDPNSDAQEEGGGFMTSLMSSMSLVLEEFYKNLRACGVSAMTGDGMEDFFEKVDEARQEYEDVYKPELQQLQADRERAKEAKKADNLSRAMNDMNVDVPLTGSARSGGTKASSAAATGRKGGKKSAAELLAELEEQERLEEEEEAEQGWQEEGEDIYREDHDMYPDLRREQEKRSGVSAARAAQSQPPKRSTKAVVDDDYGGRWPAP